MASSDKGAASAAVAGGPAHGAGHGPGEGGTRRDFSIFDRRRRGRRGRRRRRGLAVHRQMNPAADTAGAGVDRSRSLRGRGRPGHHGQMARQAGLHPPAHGRRDQGRRGRQRGGDAGPAVRRGPRQEAGMAGPGRRVHPSRLHPAGPKARPRQRRLRRLVLPVPRFALRRFGPYPQGPGARRTCWSRRTSSSTPTPRSRSAED